VKNHMTAGRGCYFEQKRRSVHRKCSCWLRRQNDFLDDYSADSETNDPVLQTFLDALSPSELALARQAGQPWSPAGEVPFELKPTAGCFQDVGANLARNKAAFTFAEKVLLVLLEADISQEIRQLTHVNLAIAYFNQRSRPGMLDRCNDHCSKAIVAGHATGWAHERLAINYEKAGELQKAIAVCELALSTEGVPSPRSYLKKDDFQKRLEKLRKKQSKITGA